MANELSIKLETSGLTIKGLIRGHNRGTRWNGSAMVASSTITDANWAVGMVALSEELTSNGTGTKRYTGSFPTDIVTAGEYEVDYYSGASPLPGDNSVGNQSVSWNGSSSTDAAILDTSTNRNAVADALLSRSITTIHKTAGQYTLSTLILATFNSVFTASTWTIYDLDDALLHTLPTTTNNTYSSVIGVGNLNG